MDDILKFFSFYKKGLSCIIQKENNNFNSEENEETDSPYLWPSKIDINMDNALDILLDDKFGKEAYISEIEKKLEDIDSKRKEILTKYSGKKKNGYKLLLDACNKSSENTHDDTDLLNEKEKSLVEQIIKEFEGTLTQLKAMLSPLDEPESKKTNYELIGEFFEKFKEVYERELDFDSNKYLSICETVQGQKGRNALIFFMLNIKKYESANSFLKEISKKLDEYYIKEKNTIFLLLNELKNETRNLIQEITKLTQMKSSQVLYKRWKYSKLYYRNKDFGSFVNLIKSYATSIGVRLNDDAIISIISNQVTSLWIIKNDLTEFVA